MFPELLTAFVLGLLFGLLVTACCFAGRAVERWLERPTMNSQ